MTGAQKIIYDQLKKVLDRLRNGYYGTGEDIDELLLEEDLQEVTFA